MVHQGRVQNGVVVLEEGILLPEGLPVRVEAIMNDATSEHEPSDEDAVFRMSDLAVDTGIPDLAPNIDHYLYGHPKSTNDK